MESKEHYILKDINEHGYDTEFCNSIKKQIEDGKSLSEKQIKGYFKHVRFLNRKTFIDGRAMSDLDMAFMQANDFGYQ